MIENIREAALPNGVRVYCESVPHVSSVAFCIMVGTGSRHEEPNERGISHVLEHMLFKGTKTRTAKQIAEEIERLGGHLNAFTDKEVTCYHARMLADDVETGIDVLCDMMANSVLTPEDVEREVSVILEEIKRRDDSPEDLVQDIFEEDLWETHPLGKPVIGTSESVSGVKRESLTNYIHRRYAPDRIVVAAAGNVDPDSFVSLVTARLGSLNGRSNGAERSEPKSGLRRNLVADDVEQVHFCIGFNGYSCHAQERFILPILDTVLGSTMSSRLFQEIREKRGLAYSIGSYFAAYDEGGYFAVYGGTGKQSFEEVQQLTLKELDRIKQEPLTDDELRYAKNHVRGSILLGLESMSSRMLRLSRNALVYDRIIPLKEILQAIEKVDQADVQRVATEMFDPDRMTLTAIGPFE